MFVKMTGSSDRTRRADVPGGRLQIRERSTDQKVYPMGYTAKRKLGSTLINDQFAQRTDVEPFFVEFDPGSG